MMYSRLFVLCCFLFLVGCSNSNSHQDLRDFISENKKRPPGKIEEPPKIQPYDSFVYDAYRLRSPFDKPIVVSADDSLFLASNGNVSPDPARQKEALEQYDLSALSMVGTIRKNNALWALIRDPQGDVFRVKMGNYMGRNHGRIVQLFEDRIDLVEIVASGESWLERPNVLELKVTE